MNINIKIETELNFSEIEIISNLLEEKIMASLKIAKIDENYILSAVKFLDQYNEELSILHDLSGLYPSKNKYNHVKFEIAQYFGFESAWEMSQKTDF